MYLSAYSVDSNVIGLVENSRFVKLLYQMYFAASCL